MTDPRAADTTPLNPPGVDVVDMRRELAGDEVLADQDGILSTDQVELRGSITDEQIDAGMAGATGTSSRVDDPESLEMLEDLDLRSDETTDPNIAAEEGLTWVPPVDPPVVPSNSREEIVVAAGFGASSLAEPFDLDHHSELLPAEDEMTARVREALRADATTTEYADSVDIDTEAGTVRSRGIVDDIDDDDNLVAVTMTVTGVEEVINELEVAGV